MNYTKPRTYTAALSLLILLSAPAVQAGLMYRYINDKGNVVLAYQVPASDIGKGYEILNEEGVVLEVVPRELTDEERANVSSEARQLADVQAERDRL